MLMIFSFKNAYDFARCVYTSATLSRSALLKFHTEKLPKTQLNPGSQRTRAKHVLLFISAFVRDCDSFKPYMLWGGGKISIYFHIIL